MTYVTLVVKVPKYFLEQSANKKVILASCKFAIHINKP